MRVVDAMTTDIVSVRSDTPILAIVNLLLKYRISAVPVLNDNGAVIGMISEGDLMPRDESERGQRRDLWLRMLAEGEDVGDEYLQHLASDKRLARDIMVTPVIAIEEDADLVAAAERMSQRRVKRLPVVRDGHIVGIISRADLVRAVARGGREPLPAAHVGSTVAMPTSPSARAPERKSLATTPHAEDQEISAHAFRTTVEDFERAKVMQRSSADHDLAEQRHREVEDVLTAALSEDRWKHLLADARTAARSGQTESLLIRFPCEVCSDHGRAVNAPDPRWPETLRGLPAEIFLRCRKEMRPRGFVLHARVTDFHNDIPSEISLFLAWS